jgi:hypothetical protein
MSSFDVPICVACGCALAHVLRLGYHRCAGCVAGERPHSLTFARQVRAARVRVLEDDDPADGAAA